MREEAIFLSLPHLSHGQWCVVLHQLGEAMNVSPLYIEDRAMTRDVAYKQELDEDGGGDVGRGIWPGRPRVVYGQVISKPRAAAQGPLESHPPLMTPMAARMAWASCQPQAYHRHHRDAYERRSSLLMPHASGFVGHRADPSRCQGKSVPMPASSGLFGVSTYCRAEGDGVAVVSTRAGSRAEVLQPCRVPC